MTGVPRGAQSSARSQLPSDLADQSVAVVSPRPWSDFIAGPLAALGAAAVTWVIFAVPPMLMWLRSNDTGSVTESVLAVAATVWLMAQGLPMPVDGIMITLVPWGLGVVIALILFAAGRWAARVAVVSRRASAVRVTVAAAITYALVTVAIATALGQPGPAPGRVLVTAAVLSAVSLGLGVFSRSGQLHELRVQVPPILRHLLAAGMMGVWVWVLAGAVLVAGALIVDTSLARSLEMLGWGEGADFGGVIAMLAITIGYLPVAIGWTISYAIGPGFIPAAQVTVGPYSTEALPALPALPYFSALPEIPPTGTAVLPLIGVCAGILAAVALRRRGLRGGVLIAASVGAIGISAVVLAGLLLASSGALGIDALGAIGPNTLPVIGVACALWALGYLIVVLLGLRTDHQHARVKRE